SEYSLSTITTSNSTASTITVTSNINTVENNNLNTTTDTIKSIKSKFSGHKFFQALGKKLKLFKNTNNNKIGGDCSKVASDFDLSNFTSTSEYDLNNKNNKNNHQSSSPVKSMHTGGSIRL